VFLGEIMENLLLPQDPTPVDLNKNIEDLDKIKYDLSPDESRGKLVITTYGEKGAGKTTAIYLIATGRIGGFPAGKTVVISFDNKSKITKEQYFPSDDITVYDGKRYYREDPTLCTKSGMMTYKYIQKLLESYKNDRPDWIIFDGFTIMAMILEMAMRYQHGLLPSQGIANLNVWKDRGRFVQDLHNLATKISKYGVAYTTYSEKNEIVESGTTITKTDVPKYIDVVMQETDVVIHTTKAKGKDGDLFYLRVESTKYKDYVDMDGNKIPYVKDVTLEQGRTYNISKATEHMPKKIVKREKTTTEKMIENIVPPSKIEQIKNPIEPVKPIETATPILSSEPVVSSKPVENVKVVEETKIPDQKPQIKKNFEIPDLLGI
jgi:hypothetical protein